MSSLSVFPPVNGSTSSVSSEACSSTKCRSSSSASKINNLLRWRGHNFATQNVPILKMLGSRETGCFGRYFLSFLEPKDLALFSQACLETDRLITPLLRDALPARIIKAKELFRDVIACDVHEIRLYRLWNKIFSDPLIRQILKDNKGDLEKTAQAIKDRDLVICVTKFLYAYKNRLRHPDQNALDQIEDKTHPLSVQAKVAREWMKSNQNNPLFGVRRLKFRKCELRTIPMEFISLFPQLERLSLSHNQIQVIPNAIERLVFLGELLLHYNKILKVPDVISALVHLNCLYLDHNQIQVVPHALAQLPLLRHIPSKIQFESFPMPSKSFVSM